MLCQGGGPGFPSWVELRSALFGLYAGSLSLSLSPRHFSGCMPASLRSRCCSVVLQISLSCKLWFILVHFWFHFGTILGFGGYPEVHLRSLCATPLPRDAPKPDSWAILGIPWEFFWSPFGSIFRSWTRGGASLRSFLTSLGHIWSPLGFDTDLECQT